LQVLENSVLLSVQTLQLLRCILCYLTCACGRDEACQTCDDDVHNPASAAKPQTPGDYTDNYAWMIRDGPVMKLAYSDGPDEEMSAWRTLLYSNSSYGDLQYDVACSEPSTDDVLGWDLRSTGRVQSDPDGKENSRALVRSLSDSRLDAAVVKSVHQKTRSMSTPNVTMPVELLMSGVASGDGLGSLGAGEAVAVSRESVSELSHSTAAEQTQSMSVGQRLQTCYGSGVVAENAANNAAVSQNAGEGKVVSVAASKHLNISEDPVFEEEAKSTSLSDVTVEVGSELQGYAASLETSSLADGMGRLPRDEFGQFNMKSDNATLLPRVDCMDRQVCCLHNDFVAHL